MSLTQVTVTGTWHRPDGAIPSGYVTFTPSSVLQNTVDDVFVASSVKATLDETGSISVDLYATDDPGTQPDGATYRVHERIDGSSRIYQVEINTGAGTVDLADLAEATADESFAYALQAHTHADLTVDGGSL